ncbi:hypothetical protein [Ideonella sp.]|uniref:hypothetical protein n=1 Tax=Ideonella sp. TaxID=1929293 RepID=UPI003BB73924
MNGMDNAPLFDSAASAVKFALRYSAMAAYPQGALSHAVQRTAIGRGKGLVGMSGAAQAGMVQAALARLSGDQLAVLQLRFGRVEVDCPECRQPVPVKAWREAAAVVGRWPELADLPGPIRSELIDSQVVGRRLDLSEDDCSDGPSLRTLQRLAREVRRRMTELENAALETLEAGLQQSGLVMPT